MNHKMKNTKTIFSLALTAMLVTFFYSSFLGQKADDNDVLVTIADEQVKVEDFMFVYNKNNTQTTMQEPTSIEDYLDLFINFKLKVKEAEELQMDTISEFQKELAGYREQLAKPYFVDEDVNEALLEEAYERMLKDVRAEHILIMVEADARPEDTLEAYNKIVEIRQEIMGGMAFADAAVAYSDDPSAKDKEEIPGKQRARKGNKGDLGYFTVFNMVYPFENAAYETPVGEVSQPIRTQYGYHLVKVTDRKDALGTAQVAHIYIALGPDITEEEAAQKEEKANNIYQKIQEGMTFEEAVVQYSEDKGSARNGGRLSKFTCNRVVAEFVLAAESLEIDEVSAPVKTRYGYHIIKLISRETPGTFDDESEGLKKKLSKDDRSHLSEEAVINRIKAENKLKIYGKTKQAFFATVDTSVLNATYVIDSGADLSKVIVKLGSDKHTQEEFASYVVNQQRKQANIDKDVYLEKLFNKWLDDVCMRYEDAHLEEKYPEFRALMKEYHDGILLFNLTDEKVWTKAVKDTAGLEVYFNNNRDNYQWGERIDATLFEIRNLEDFEAAQKIILENESDGDVAKALDADSITSVTIIPGKFEKGDNQVVDDVNWNAGTVQQIHSDVEKLITIVRIREVLPPGPKEIDEARGIATADYQTYLEQAWVEQLKEKYPVVINEEVLQQLVNNQ
jgi:peptidyl-prolyl cis-trans isomerase SurA